MTQFEQFEEAWNDLTDDQKISIYQEWQRENDPDSEWFCFDEYFFETYFTNAMDAVRAWHFGPEKNWNDEFIGFTGYGNLKTASTWEVAQEADDHKEDIFECPELWEDVITICEFEED